MKVDTKNKTITETGYELESWGNVRWLINELTRNAEFLWGAESAQKPTATILKLVRKDSEK